MKHEDYTTSDLNLAAVLSMQGFTLTDISDPRSQRAVFHFQSSDALEECVQQFWRRELNVEPQALFEAIKFIKSRIYSER